MNNLQKPNPDLYVARAIELHNSFVAVMSETKKRAFECGLLLLCAHELVPEGNWGVYLESFQEELPRRTAYHYMRFASDCLEWARQQHPALISSEEIQALARDMVLESTLSFCDLMREVGLARTREGGGYRSEKRRRGTSDYTQLQFDADLFRVGLGMGALAGRKALMSFEVDQVRQFREQAETVLKECDAVLAEKEKGGLLA